MIKVKIADIEDEILILGFKIIGEFKSLTKKVTLVDNEEYLYYYSISELKSNIKRKRDMSRFHVANPYTIQNIKLWCKLNNKPFELISDMYEGANKKLKWKCLKEECGEEFDTLWGDISQGKGCGYCDGKQVGLSNCLATKNPELASEWHPIKNGELTPYNVTSCSNKSVWWECEKNSKHEWEATIGSRSIKGDGCPYCSGHLPSEDYNLLVSNPELCKEWNYNKNNKRPEEYTPVSGENVFWECKTCGNEWIASIANRNKNNNRRTNCPSCSRSKGEIRIEKWLISNEIFYSIEYDKFTELISKLGNPLRFDFAVYKDIHKSELKMLIEFDGKQHFELVPYWQTEEGFETLQYHDRLKDEYCKNKGIRLLRIKYDRFDNIEEILSNELL